jgi:hypothetical protein
MGLGSGIRDPGSEIRDPEKKPIPEPGSGFRVKKTPDPGSGSAILVATSIDVGVHKHC